MIHIVHDICNIALGNVKTVCKLHSKFTTKCSVAVFKGSREDVGNNKKIISSIYKRICVDWFVMDLSLQSFH